VDNGSCCRDAIQQRSRRKFLHDTCELPAFYCYFCAWLRKGRTSPLAEHQAVAGMARPALSATTSHMVHSLFSSRLRQLSIAWAAPAVPLRFFFSHIRTYIDSTSPAIRPLTAP
jgi:hypothetical protein